VGGLQAYCQTLAIHTSIPMMVSFTLGWLGVLQKDGFLITPEVDTHLDRVFSIFLGQMVAIT
jgi:hypothetical protein